MKSLAEPFAKLAANCVGVIEVEVLMRGLLMAMVMVSVACCSIASAQNSNSGKTLTDAERAHLKKQVESLQKSKLQAGEKAGQLEKDSAARKMQAVDQKHQNEKDYVDRKSKEWSYVVGPEHAHNVGEMKKQELSQQAKAEKAKIAGEAKDRADRKQAAAKKYADNVNQSVDGLKSQVTKDGQYGLKPKGSSLYVRQYGK